MNKQVLSGMGLGALLLFILIGAGVYVSSQGGNNSEGSISEAAVTEFTEAMRNEVLATGMRPIEGFEPIMFLEVFPGLTAQDFDGVEAAIGLYRYENGEVVYDLNGERELHSAARAITDDGMFTLLINITARLNYNLEGENTVDDVIRAISQASGEGAAGGGIEPTLFDTVVTFSGTIVCLPHKGDGPHTMECAYGLKADNGSHYGLKNLFTEPGPWEFDVSDRIEVTGLLEEPDPNTSYDIAGTIDVESKRGL